MAEAYVRGLERLVESRRRPDGRRVRRVVLRLARRHRGGQAARRAPGGPSSKGKLAIANAKLAYQQYEQIFSGERWERLAARGATPQWCLWASTSTKNPEYRDVLYVEELIGRDTVNTMPLETIRAFQDHGEVADTLEQDLEGARQVFADLQAAGVDYDDVTDTLEREGVQKFSDSFAELLDGIRAKQRELVSA